MKVIHQLIDYLHERGILSLDEVDYLRREGYYPALSFDDMDPSPAEDEPWLLPDESSPLVRTAGAELDLLEEEAWRSVQRETLTRRRRAGGAPRKGRPRRSSALIDRLSALIPGWEGELEGIVQVASWLVDVVGAGAGDACAIIRTAASDDLTVALVAGVDARRPSLTHLWDALCFEGYRSVLDEPQLKGPTLDAYAEILAGAGRADLGAFGWLERRPEVRWVADLVRAQHRLLTVAGTLYHQQPATLTRWLRRDRHEVAYWAFVILHSACRFDPSRPEAAVAPFRSEQPPARRLPDWYAWMQAWGHALIMDPDRVTPFFTHRFAPLLVHYFESPDGDHAAMPAHAPGFLCPAGWDR